MTSTIYIGVDPDIRTLNVAVMLSTTIPYKPPVVIPLAVFLRRNKSHYTGDRAVADAVKVVGLLVDDVIKFFISNPNYQEHAIVLVAEGQSMQHLRHANRTRRIDPDDILHTGQIIGILMGSFRELADRIVLVSPIKWKGSMPKDIHHKRIYNHLGWAEAPVDLGRHSGERVNKGDFEDINDSIGLALYGATENL